MPVYAWDTDDCRCVRDRAYATTFLFGMAMNLKLLLKIKSIKSNNIHRLTIKINAKRKIRINQYSVSSEGGVGDLAIPMGRVQMPITKGVSKPVKFVFLLILAYTVFSSCVVLQV